MDYEGLRACDRRVGDQSLCLVDLHSGRGAHTVERFAIPHDFTDGFQAAYWRRPEIYLNPEVRAASSTFASLPSDLVELGIQSDLQTGKWLESYGDLVAWESADLGHRIVIAG
ncbi:MAG TPA: hypothetical protein VG032_12285 [Acidimicrobiales bacterium]|jgi:hypothetical protein|nr:hypothetical protein [Acidimicrobiales bacterium]